MSLVVYENLFSQGYSSFWFLPTAMSRKLTEFSAQEVSEEAAVKGADGAAQEALGNPLRSTPTTTRRPVRRLPSMEEK